MAKKSGAKLDYSVSGIRNIFREYEMSYRDKMASLLNKSFEEWLEENPEVLKDSGGGGGLGDLDLPSLYEMETSLEVAEFTSTAALGNYIEVDVNSDTEPEIFEGILHLLVESIQKPDHPKHLIISKMLEELDEIEFAGFIPYYVSNPIFDTTELMSVSPVFNFWFKPTPEDGLSPERRYLSMRMSFRPDDSIDLNLLALDWLAGIISKGDSEDSEASLEAAYRLLNQATNSPPLNVVATKRSTPPKARSKGTQRKAPTPTPTEGGSKKSHEKAISKHTAGKNKPGK